jgi:hypothetical protein
MPRKQKSFAATEEWITVHSVASAMGLVLTNDQAWRAGSGVMKLWVWETGSQPVKDNRMKKSGAGNHCFALYPPTAVWRERIKRWIETVRAEDDAQGSFGF